MGVLSVSMLAADFGHLAQSCTFVNESPAQWVHLDVMDGVFVPNISYGFPVMAAIAKHSTKILDAHLMVINPQQYYTRCKDLGVSWLTVHYEACPHLHRDIQQIHQLGMKAGVAINPATPVCILQNIVAFADLILIMSVNPGFGGQQFIEESLAKIEELRELRNKTQTHFLIEVDGGISPKNAPSLYVAGADVLVSGNGVFNAPDPLQATRAIIG